MAHTINLSNEQVIVCSLFVHHPIMAPNLWRLLWAESVNADTFIHAEGECSAKHFKTMREAVAYGKRVYGEVASRFAN